MKNMFKSSKIVLSVYKRIIISLFYLFLVISSLSGQEKKEWKVWVKTSPCSGRFDWITVAKENPSIYGLETYELASRIESPLNCTVTGCTFQEATFIANSVRSSDMFFNFCCKDYSVWENVQTGERSVVIGKFSTAGYPWQALKFDLCCEEAEDLADLVGACSGYDGNEGHEDCKMYPGSVSVWNDNTQTMECLCPKGKIWNTSRTACIEVQNADCSAYPGSYAAWNDKTNRVECYCPDGKIWNRFRTACIDDISKIECWPGSHAVWNEQLEITECFCNEGLVWNKTKTACVDPKRLVKEADCSNYKGSHAVWNDQTQQVECVCPDGKIWNSSFTACIDDISKVKCWPGSYAVWNEQRKKTECFCNQGLVWNKTKTACVDPKSLVKEADCSYYKGSHAVWNDQTQQVECVCPDGKIWNSSFTACIDDISIVKCWPGSYAVWNEQLRKSECYCNQGLVWNKTKTACVEPDIVINKDDGKQKPGEKGTWSLTSVKVNPEKRTGWTYSSQSSSAHYDVYNGDKVDFNWTPPPSTISESGFTVSIGVTSTLGPYSRIMSSIIGVSGVGLDSDTPPRDRIAESNIPTGSASPSKTVNFKPNPSASQIEVEIGMMWGEVKFIYIYKKN